MNRIFKIVPDGVSYDQLFTDVQLNCQVCDKVVTKVSYSERTGMGTWICQNMHLSREKIGV